VFEALREREVGVNLHYIPVHIQQHYKKMGFRAGDFPEAECYTVKQFHYLCFMR
tara:strand:+ start:289 stop:450 length:162 start_codon:yes stop_codon:yes gene_type:complete